MKIFRHKTCNILDTEDKVMGDRGCRNARYITPDDMPFELKSIHGHLRARHKTCNGRFKRFSIFANVFRHNIELLASVFHAVSKIYFS